MTDQPALPPAPQPERDRTGLFVTCATLIILAALGTGGFVLKQELSRMANAKPVAPKEVTDALADLRSQLDQQRSDSATQLQNLQNEIAAMKEQQAAQPVPDVGAAIAPVQEKLDAIAAQLQEAPKQDAAVAPAPDEASPDAPPSASPAPQNLQLTLRDYLALRRTVESGAPYARELAVLIPQLPAEDMEAISMLQRHAEQGLGEDDEETDAPKSALKPWMERVNDKLRGLVSIKPSDRPRATPQARAQAMAALDRIEANLMDGQ